MILNKQTPPACYGATISPLETTTMLPLETDLPGDEEEEDDEDDEMDAIQRTTASRNTFSGRHPLAPSSWFALAVIVTLGSIFFMIVSFASPTDVKGSFLQPFFLRGTTQPQQDKGVVPTVPQEKDHPFAVSIWLIPPPNILSEMQPFIDALAQLQPDASAPFVPHITITGGVTLRSPKELEQVARNLSTLLEDDEGIECEFDLQQPQTNLDNNGTVVWSQAFLLKMNVSPAYQSICQATRESLGLTKDSNHSDACHNPHMSLLYSYRVPTAEVQEYWARHPLALPLQFTAQRIAVVTTDPSSVEGVQEWNSYSEFYLGKH